MELNGHLKGAYSALLDDNLIHLIKYVYRNKNVKPYSNINTRVDLIMHMLSTTHLKTHLNFDISTMIARDIDTVKCETESIDRKIKLNSYLELLKQSTELDETLSLNVVDPSDPLDPSSSQFDDKSIDIDINSQITTLNTLAPNIPIQRPTDNNCCIS